MTTNVDQALSLASRGYHVFPCEENGKLPVIKDYPNRATRDEKQIRKWFSKPRNIGISTTRFGDDQALVVVDVDVKEGKDGDATMLTLEMEGHEFPVTLEQQTPSGGRHLVYVTDAPLRQGVDVLGRGLDIRSRGGYILGPGSTIDGKPYQQINGHGVMVPAPGWLVDRLGADRRDAVPGSGPVAGVDPDRAWERALNYLTTDAPYAVEGNGGDHLTFKVAAKIKDLGCTEEQCLRLMLGWNDLCQPPWAEDELARKVANAYRYGREPQGIDAPEAVFPPAPPEVPDAGLHPFDQLNQEYAFVKCGAFVLHETTDEKGNYTTQQLSLAEYHAWFANRPFTVGQDTKPISRWWMSWAKRRQYERVVFMPQQHPGPRFFNLWRGFRVEPVDRATHPALAMFLEHARVNVCGNDPELFKYLMGYFAHLIQRPWEKPLVALVFKGGKGVGKNALVERVGALLGSHFLVADDDRYLLGNFNSHLESNLFFVLDEAAWAGDKRAEGKLKGLITGQHHNIERKGREPYKIDNLTRVAILGNEDWLVPASQDERRFAVFNVGEGRKQDRKFFEDMRLGMEAGGYCHLLRYLMDFDISNFDINDAPKTEALMEQKLASLEPLQEWWLECLRSQTVAGSDFGGEWPATIPTYKLREALRRWAGNMRNIKSRMPSDQAFGRAMTAMGITKTRAGSGNRENLYEIPPIDIARKSFERHLQGEIAWE